MYSHIFDTCTRTGIFPGKWKMSTVCPIHKKVSKNLKVITDPYHSFLAKMLEKIIFETLYDYFINNKLITPCQFGFIKGDSFVNQLMITHEIHKHLDANPSIDTVGVFLDMSKAFDKVSA